MTLPTTQRVENALARSRINPQLVLEIEGVPTKFSAVEILRLVRVGDDGLLIGDAWAIGGLIAEEDQADLISLDANAGTSISQQLQPDKGNVSSVASIQLVLTDRQLAMTKVLSPGFIIEDIMGANATLWMGFAGAAFKEDYVPIFSGIIDDTEAGAGNVKINIASPDQLKRQEIFTGVEVTLAANMTIGQTTVVLEDVSGLPLPATGPDGTEDPAIRFYVRIEDEFIRYTGIDPVTNTLSGCTRAALASNAATHTIADQPITGKSAVSIEDTAINCALKIMLSGRNGAFKSGVSVKQYLHPDPLTTVANSIFFSRIDLNRDLGVVAGDFITITGATATENNCAAKTIQEIVTTNDGSYAIINDVTFVEEVDSAAVVAFRSQYDTLGYGLAMSPAQVDVLEHIFWNDYQLASFSYRFVIDDTINGKDFLDKEVYLPIGAYSLTRQGRSSMGYHIGPVIRGSLKILSKDNIKNPDKIRLRRTINRNFYNTIIYKFDEVALTGKMASGSISISQDSKNRIPVGTKALTVNASGMRRNLDGTGIAQRVSDRYLGRYKYAAEFFESIGVLFRDGYSIEPGDVVMLDPTDLNITNTMGGNRNKAPKVFTVTNKKMDMKTGDVQIALTDTNFDETERYGSVAPSSLVTGGTTTAVMIQDSFGAIFPGQEYRKWEDYLGQPIIVHSPDWTFSEEVTLESIDAANRYQLNLAATTPLSAPPSAGYIVDIPPYPVGTDPALNGRYKAIHSFVGPSTSIFVYVFDDRAMLLWVPPDLQSCFVVGGHLRVRSPDYTRISPDSEIEVVWPQLDGSLYVRVKESLGFEPDGYDIIEGLDFADGGKTYLIF